MNKIKKALCTMSLAVGATLAISITSFAGTWCRDTSGWWFQNDNGTYLTDTWRKIDGKWYYFNASGYMVTGWVKTGDIWYYCNLDGSLATDSWIDGKYYVGSDGVMYVNKTTPDGYQVDGQGAILNQYSEYVGDYDWEGDLEILEYMGYKQKQFRISKIENGKIYGTYWQGVGAYSGVTADFSHGVPIVNGLFTINACYSDAHADFDPIERCFNEYFEYYTINCSLDIKDGKPIIRNEQGYYWDTEDNIMIYIKY